MTDFSLCQICGGKLNRQEDREEGRVLEQEENCPHCQLYLFEFHYGHSEQRYGVIYTSWSYEEDSPKDWREQREEARAIWHSPTGCALFKAMWAKNQNGTEALILADWCAENGLVLSEKYLRENVKSWPYYTPRPTPPCRVCGKAFDVICFPDERDQAICPECCDKAEHQNGETGHLWEYDRWERGRACVFCGILRRCTEYAYDD